MIIKILQEFNRVLRKGGTLLLMHPNIRYAYREYWDFLIITQPCPIKAWLKHSILPADIKLKR